MKGKHPFFCSFSRCPWASSSQREVCLVCDARGRVQALSHIRGGNRLCRGGSACFQFLAVLSGNPGHSLLGPHGMHVVGRSGPGTNALPLGLTQKCQKSPWGAKMKKELSIPLTVSRWRLSPASAALGRCGQLLAGAWCTLGRAVCPGVWCMGLLSSYCTIVPVGGF